MNAEMKKSTRTNIQVDFVFTVSPDGSNVTVVFWKRFKVKRMSWFFFYEKWVNNFNCKINWWATWTIFLQVDSVTVSPDGAKVTVAFWTRADLLKGEARLIWEGRLKDSS